MKRRSTAANSTYPKVAVQWLNQALCFYQSLCLVDSEVLRNRHLRVAAKRCGQTGRDTWDSTSRVIKIPADEEHKNEKEKIELSLGDINVDILSSALRGQELKFEKQKPKELTDSGLEREKYKRLTENKI